VNESSIGFVSRIDNRFSSWRTRLLPRALVVLLFALSFDSASAQSAARLQPLLNDTVAQLKLVSRHDADELHRRYEQVSKALAAWRAADRTEENNRRLEAWLRTAIRSSMPGADQAMPTVPEFESSPAPLPLPATPPLTERTRPPAASAVDSPPKTMPSPTTSPNLAQPQPPEAAAVAEIEASKPITPQPASASTPTAENEAELTTASDNAMGDQLPGTELSGDQLPEIVDEPGTDELPEPDAPPEIEEDPALIEALGDPFVDDPSTTE
jgi:hypothetical protein